MKKVLLAALLCLSISPAFSQTNIQFEEDEAEENVNISFDLKSSASGGFTVVFDYRDANNFYALDCAKGKIALRSVISGVPHKLAESVVAWKPQSSVTIKRRFWLMQVIVDKNVALTAYDVTLNSGKIGAISDGWKWSEVRVQPTESELFFNDDFTREVGKTGDWKTASGDWKLTSSSDNINQGNQAMSANPFSYQALAASTPALATSGRAFWDNYDAQVSVRPAAQGTIGLAFYVQDAKNYLAFLWSSKEGKSARQLVKVENGATRVLASSAGAFLPRQWYRLSVRTSPDYIETFLDGEAIFRTRDSAFGQGGIGLFASQTSANFDDVRVRSYPYFRQDFNGPTGGAWTPNGGFWKAAAGVLNSASKPGDNGATRMILTGSSSWENYEVSASGKSGNSGANGLIVGYRDDKNYTVFRWAGVASTLPFKGRAQLLRYDNGAAKILSDAPAPKSAADGFVRVKMRFKAGAITTLVNNEIVAQAADETFKNGRVGLWAQGAATASFRDVVMYLPLEPEAPKVAAKFESDALMVGWASSAGEWPPLKKGDYLEFWNTGEFFGDTSVEYVWKPSVSSAGAVEWALRANDKDFSSGFVLRAESKNDSKADSKTALNFTLSQNGKLLKQASADLQTLKITDANPAKIRVDLEGRAILVSVNDAPVLSYLADEPSTPSGTKLGMRSETFTLAVKDLRATSANRDDYTFSEAPTDWYAPSGNWNIFSRWPCYSDWSFFGGKGQSPALWSKREYSGDTVVEMYVHPQMSLPKELGYAHPGDLNITLFGDGTTVSSGYSFILAGWSNTKSAIMKGREIVAESSAANAYFQKAINQNSGFHRRWYYVRAEARKQNRDGQAGTQLRFFVDDQLMAEYFDAAPLSAVERGGRVAFWTVDGAMMIARAKIESEKPMTRALPGNLPDAAANAPANAPAGFLEPRAVLQDGRPSSAIQTQDAAGVWKIINPTGGGVFAISLNGAGENKTWKAGANTKFDADLMMFPNAKVDLYFTVNGVRHQVELNGNQRADVSVKKLGAVSAFNQTDNKASDELAFHHLSFALGDALKELYPQSSSWTIEKIEIGALHGDEYRWQGFFGNPLGASYLLKNAKLTEN